MELALKIFQFILSISILVVLHEMGHFLPAKWFKTRAEKFFLFFDPYFSIFSMKKINGKWKYKFFSKNLPDTEVIVRIDGKKKEVPIDTDKLPDGDWRKYPDNTKYGIGWLPFGGYVKIAGMVDESMDVERLKKPAENWEFRAKPAWQRLIVMAGGVTVNFFLAWIIYSSIMYFKGETIFDATKIKNEIKYSESAKKIGFEDGDKILKVDGKVQNDFKKLSIDILLSDSVTVLRNGKEVTFHTKDDGKAEVLSNKTQAFFLSPRMTARVDTILTKSAIDAGLKQGDIIKKVDNKPIKFYDEITTILDSNSKKNVVLEVDRNGKTQTLDIPLTDGRIGIATYKEQEQYISNKQYSLLESIPEGFVKSIESLIYQIKSFKLVFSSKVQGYKNVSGPLGIIKQMPVASDGNSYSIDWVAFWGFTAMFSVWLAFLNLLPIPGLDGGHIIFTLWEMITRRPVPQKVLENAQMIGVIFLMGLMLLIFGNDIVKLILGKL